MAAPTETTRFQERLTTVQNLKKQMQKFHKDHSLHSPVLSFFSCPSEFASTQRNDDIICALRNEGETNIRNSDYSFIAIGNQVRMGFSIIDIHSTLPCGAFPNSSKKKSKPERKEFLNTATCQKKSTSNKARSLTSAHLKPRIPAQSAGISRVGNRTRTDDNQNHNLGL